MPSLKSIVRMAAAGAGFQALSFGERVMDVSNRILLAARRRLRVFLREACLDDLLFGNLEQQQKIATRRLLSLVLQESLADDPAVLSRVADRLVKNRGSHGSDPEPPAKLANDGDQEKGKWVFDPAGEAYWKS